MNIADRLKRAMLKMQVYRDEHPKSRTHQKVLLEVSKESYIKGSVDAQEILLKHK
jgi:hypothetical protein